MAHFFDGGVLAFVGVDDDLSGGGGVGAVGDFGSRGGGVLALVEDLASGGVVAHGGDDDAVAAGGVGLFGEGVEDGVGGGEVVLADVFDGADDLVGMGGFFVLPDVDAVDGDHGAGFGGRVGGVGVEVVGGAGGEGQGEDEKEGGFHGEGGEDQITGFTKLTEWGGGVGTGLTRFTRLGEGGTRLSCYGGVWGGGKVFGRGKAMELGGWCGVRKESGMLGERHYEPQLVLEDLMRLFR